MSGHPCVMDLPPEPVDTPSGRSFVVRTYRSGTMDRFPSTWNTPGKAAQSGALLLPLVLLGLLLHIAVYRAGWTVAVTPWHNLPGPRHRERVRSEAEATVRAAELSAALAQGTWAP